MMLREDSCVCLFVCLFRYCFFFYYFTVDGILVLQITRIFNVSDLLYHIIFAEYYNIIFSYVQIIFKASSSATYDIF